MSSLLIDRGTYLVCIAESTSCYYSSMESSTATQVLKSYKLCPASAWKITNSSPLLRLVHKEKSVASPLTPRRGGVPGWRQNKPTCFRGKALKSTYHRTIRPSWLWRCSASPQREKLECDRSSSSSFNTNLRRWEASSKEYIIRQGEIRVGRRSGDCTARLGIKRS